MAAERLSMRKIKEVLRLQAAGHSQRAISNSTGIARSTVREYQDRASNAGLSWPLPDHLTDSALEDLLFRSTATPGLIRPLPDWKGIYDELKLLLLIGGALLGLNLAMLSLAVFGVVLLIAAPTVVRVFPHASQFTSGRFSALSTVTPWTMWALVWTAAASWLAWGLGLLFLARGLFVEPTAPVGAYVTAWIASFLGGLVAFVAPAGLGVRDELMRTTLVTAGLGPGPALVVTIVARVWATILDVVPALGVLGLRLMRRRRPSTEDLRGQISA